MAGVRNIASELVKDVGLTTNNVGLIDRLEHEPMGPELEQAYLQKFDDAELTVADLKDHMMLTSTRKYTKQPEAGASKMNPNKAPAYFHTIEIGNAAFSRSGSSLNRIKSTLSCVNVCIFEANQLEKNLQKEYFTKWKENCDVQEFHGCPVDQLDTLIKKISSKFEINGINLSQKLDVIHLAKEVEVQIYEFTFGEQMSSGKMHFGMIAISKTNNSVEAVSCLFTLDFEIAKVLVEKVWRKRVMGMRVIKRTSSWYEPKNLGFITQKALTNFCRYKAPTEFKKRDLVSRINDVPSVDDI